MAEIIMIKFFMALFIVIFVVVIFLSIIYDCSTGKLENCTGCGSQPVVVEGPSFAEGKWWWIVCEKCCDGKGFKY